jgi:hypothetical protein
MQFHTLVLTFSAVPKLFINDDIQQSKFLHDMLHIIHACIIQCEDHTYTCSILISLNLNSVIMHKTKCHMHS